MKFGNIANPNATLPNCTFKMKKILALILFLISTNLWSAMIIETIQLQHRPADEVIPIIKPMLAPEASITGTGYKLIIKSTPDNLSEIQELLEEIDIDKNQLRISVSMGRQTDAKESGVEGQVAITNEKAKFDARIYQTESSKNKPAVQIMSVTEGYWASISMGQSIPTATRTRNPDGTVTESITYQEVMTGYSVMPRTHGNQVTLTIRPLQQSSADNSAIEYSEIETTITGKIGEWLFLGGTDQEENLRSSGITHQTRIRSTDVNEVWVKVDRP